MIINTRNVPHEHECELFPVECEGAGSWLRAAGYLEIALVGLEAAKTSE